MVEILKDEEIISLIINGRTQLYSELVMRYQQKLFSTVYGYTHNIEDTNDLAQEIFIKVYNNLGNYKNISKFSTWFYRIAVNACIDWTRKRRLKTVSIIETDEEGMDIFETVSDCTYSPEEIVLKDENREAIKALIMKLPEIYKTVVVLYYYESFSPIEIAEILDIPRKTVDTRLYRARDIIRSNIERLRCGGDAIEL